ncbi:hypothetical protein F4810DRAFT_644820 [Camillea tinctor]|nr:hypothetical protein F4810DRAFT_644820 [Camillea tinctor]
MFTALCTSFLFPSLGFPFLILLSFYSFPFFSGWLGVFHTDVYQRVLFQFQFSVGRFLFIVSADQSTHGPIACQKKKHFSKPMPISLC